MSSSVLDLALGSIHFNRSTAAECVHFNDDLHLVRSNRHSYRQGDSQQARVTVRSVDINTNVTIVIYVQQIQAVINTHTKVVYS